MKIGRKHPINFLFFNITDEISDLTPGGMAKRVNKNHYVARRPTESPIPVHVPRSVYSDGEESQRAPSERTLSEYTVRFHNTR